MKTVTAIVVLLLAAAAYVYFFVDPKTVEMNQNQTATYTNNELGLQFSYRSGSNGYVVQEMTPADERNEHLRTIVLMRSQDVGKTPEGGEGPPTITIDVFANPQKQQPGNWALAHTQFSSINLATGTATEAVVGGANAVRYMADGLYVSEKLVAAHGSNMYIFSGAFIDADSQLRRDFQPLIDSVQFIERPGDSAGTNLKINIGAVCEGALAYMTFENGAAADAFVAECKEGKHPEVIERYKASLNLDGAAI